MTAPAPFDLSHTPIENGITLIEASAGTGKTFCITAIVLRLLLEREWTIDQILVVTFTNAATAELLTRVRTRIREAIPVLAGEAETGDAFLQGLRARHGAAGSELLRRALADFDNAAIHTIHGACQRLLGELAFESGTPFQLRFLVEDRDLLEQAAQDAWRATVYGNDLLAAVAVAKGWTPDTYVDAYREWMRHPRTALRPRIPPLERVLENCHGVLSQLQEAWDPDGLASTMDAVRWTVKAPFHERHWGSVKAGIEALLDDAMNMGAGIDHVVSCARTSLLATVFKKDRDRLPDHLFIRAASAFARALEDLEHALRRCMLRDMHARFEREKQRQHVLTFDDSLRRLREALADPSRAHALAAGIRARYRCALIDEFQDTDPVQYGIFKRALRRGPLFFIGDPKQAIYAFRGADVFAYLEAKRDADRAYTLGVNWRSTAAMVGGVNALFARAPAPFLYDGIPFDPVQPADIADTKTLSGDGKRALALWYVPAKPGPKGPKNWTKEDGETLACRAVAAEAVMLLTSGTTLGGEPVQPRHMAVLTRTRAQAMAVRDALQDAGVPAVVGHSGDVFQTAEMDELTTVLWAMVDPRHPGRVRAATATTLWGWPASRVRELGEDDAAWERITDDLTAYRQTWQRQGFMAAVQDFFRANRVRQRLLSLKDGERRVTNLLHAAELLQETSATEFLSPEGLLHWLARAAAEHLPDPERAELRLDRDEQAVFVTTIHKAKGLEWDIVFCPFLWAAHQEKNRGYRRAHVGASVVLDFGDPDRGDRWAQAAIAEELAEETRLAYVALTRAKHRTYVMWGALGIKGAGAVRAALGTLLHPVAGDLAAVPPPERARKALETLAGRAPEWETDVHAFANAHPDSVSIEVLANVPTPGVWSPPRPPYLPLAPRESGLTNRKAQLQPWGLTSYSAIVEHGNPTVARDTFDPPAPRTQSLVEPEGIFAFPKGPDAGTALHLVFEHADFTRVDGEDTDALVEWCLSRYDLLGAAEVKAQRVRDIRGMLQQVVRTPMPLVDFPLSSLSPAQRLNEWRFYLPLETATPARLRTVFESHASGDRLRGEYAARLGDLSARELSGFLTGIVDLVAEHDGRYVVVDWKSNHLGNTAAEYTPDALWVPMRDHHYVLQYHLYLLALHRFLRWRLPDYDYDRHVGGAVYVFLRGVDGTPGRGWYTDRPSRELIEALEEAICPEVPAR